jgi:hypothetical protein
MRDETAIQCTHERAAGTGACLKCLREQRRAAADRQRKALVQLGGVAMLLVAIGVGGVYGFRTMMAPAGDDSASADVQLQGDSGAPGDFGAGDQSAVTSEFALSALPSTQQNAGGDTLAAAPPAAGPRPLVPEGRTELGDSIYVVRSGDLVTVHFDSWQWRTRRADKLERLVRETLPRVLAVGAGAGLDTLALDPSHVLTVLPERGFALAIPAGGEIMVLPQLRPGRDGPLVVAYQARFRSPR